MKRPLGPLTSTKRAAIKFPEQAGSAKNADYKLALTKWTVQHSGRDPREAKTELGSAENPDLVAMLGRKVGFLSYIN